MYYVTTFVICKKKAALEMHVIPFNCENLIKYNIKIRIFLIIFFPPRVYHSCDVFCSALWCDTNT